MFTLASRNGRRTGLQLILGAIAGIGAAIRGNWSPCGESLQAQIHPLGESSRNNSWFVTIAAFTIGSVTAGALLGAVFGSLGGQVFPDLSNSAALVLTAVAVALGGLLDLSPLKPWTPRRQVNENWIGRYRGWVYGAAFGIQLGLGFAVFVMSWGYYSMLLAAGLSRSAVAGATMGAAFGLGRGLLLYMSKHITTPERLARFHARMQTMKAPVFRFTGVASLVMALIAAISI